MLTSPVGLPPAPPEKNVLSPPSLPEKHMRISLAEQLIQDPVQKGKLGAPCSWGRLCVRVAGCLSDNGQSSVAAAGQGWGLNSDQGCTSSASFPKPH